MGRRWGGVERWKFEDMDGCQEIVPSLSLSLNIFGEARVGVASEEVARGPVRRWLGDQ